MILCRYPMRKIVDGASADIFEARNIEWEKGREWLLELCEGNDSTRREGASIVCCHVTCEWGGGQGDAGGSR